MKEEKNESLVGKQRKTRKLRYRDIIRPRETTRGSSEPCFAKPTATLLPHTPFQHTQGPTDPRLYNNTPTDPETPPPSSTATRRRRIAGERFRPRGPRLARRRRGLGPGRGVGNAQSRVRGGWKLLIALLENPKGSHPSGLKD